MKLSQVILEGANLRLTAKAQMLFARAGVCFMLPSSDNGACLSKLILASTTLGHTLKNQPTALINAVGTPEKRDRSP